MVGLLAAGALVSWRAVDAESAVQLHSLARNDTVALPDDPPARPVTPSHVVVLGDSVATGAGCGCTPLGPLLARASARASHREVEVTSLAQDGLTSAGLLQQVSTDPTTRAALRRATAVTVTIGANDFDPSQAETGCNGAGAACFDAGLATLAKQIAAVLSTVRSLAGPGARLLVTGYWNVFLDGQVGAGHGPTYQQTSDLLTRRANAVLAAATRVSGGTYIDLYGAFRGDGDRDDTALLASDGDHPSALGSQLIARLLAGQLTPR
jgi:lysophospholipase L1-like esterase